MTANADAYPTLREKMEGRARPAPSPDQQDDTLAILRRLVSYMAGGEQRGRFIVALVLRLIGTLALIAIPFFVGLAINELGSPTPTTEALLPLVLAAAASVVVYLLLSTVAERMFSDLATSGLAKLQQDLFNHMQTLSLSFFDRQPLGQLLSRVTNDTETVAVFFESALSQIIRALFQIVIISVVMLLVDWRLAIVAFLMVPVMLFVTTAIQRVSTPAFTRLQGQVGDLSGFQEETISGNKVIISNRRAGWAEETNDELAGFVYETASQAFFTALLNYPVTQMLSVFMTVLVLVIGSLQALSGEMEVGTIVAFMSYVSLLASPLSDIANLTATTLNAVSGGRRVFAIMDEQPTVVDVENAADFTFDGGHVVFDDVDFSYVPGRKILKHNTFDAQPGQKIGICGPTGAGKSTIINILTRYYDIDSGLIEIDGQDISLLTQASLRRQIGVVLQEAFLFSDTVMNNLKYAREGATDEECIAAAKEANAHEFIMNLPQGYDTMMTERGANLSQGQRQMITIARAMVAQPKLLVLDEATSNIDTRTEKLIQEGLNRLMADKTSFVIAHRLSTIRDSHKILVLNGGVIEEQGTHDELMAMGGLYYTLYMSQFKGKAPGGADAGDAVFVST